MRIGFDAKRLFNNATGLGNYSRTLVRNLKTFFPENEYFLYSPRIGESQPFFATDSFGLRSTKSPFKSLWRSRGIPHQLQGDGIEIYHGLSNELPITIRKSTARSIVTIHDLIFRILPETYPFIDRKIYDFKVRKACSDSDHIIAVSESTKRDIIEHYGIDAEKISVIYQACDRVFYNEVIAVEVPLELPPEYLLCVGAVTERKNVIGIIEALKHLPRNMRLPLVVVGNGGKYFRKAQAVADKEGVDCHWLTRVESTAQLKVIYQKATVLLYPSLYEGFGLPIVEALLCGTPVITSKTSSMPEAGGPASVYVDPNNTEELASAINLMFTDSGKRESMKEDGLRYALGKFDPKRLTEELVGLYRQVAEG